MAGEAAAQEVQPVGPESGVDFQVITDEAVENAVQKWLFENLFTPAKTYRSQVAEDTKWESLRNLLGMNARDQWTGEEAPEDYPTFSANITFATVDTVKGIALQAPGAVEFVPVEPDDEQFAAELTVIISDYLWGVRKARFKLGIAFLEGATIGTAWSHTYWNGVLRGGDGDADFDILPADEVWVDPTCRGVNDWQYIIHAPRRPTLEVQYDDYRYNEQRLLVRPDGAQTEGQKAETPEGIMPLTTVYSYWVKGVWLRALVGSVPGLESYVDDDAWKYGMNIIVASERVVKIESHPFKCDRLPFQRFVYYQPTGNQRIYGSGDVELLKDIQLSLNARVTQMLEQASLIANQQWAISTGVVMDEAELTNKAGQIIHVDGPPDLVKRLEAPGISGSLFGITNLLMELQDFVSGMYQVNRGATPGSLRAGVAIEALQRGGEGRTLQKVANFDDFIADIAVGLADVIAAMYDEERTFRIVGAAAESLNAKNPDAGVTDYGSAEENDTAEVAGQQRSTEIKMSSARFKKGDKMVELDCRSMVSLYRKSADELRTFFTELLREGVIDAQYAIEQMPLPDKERLLTRLFATQQQAAPAGEELPDEVEIATGNDSAVPDEDAEQMSQAVEAALAQLMQAEQQGMVPQGFTAQVEQAVAAEIQQGGTGEVALQQAMQVLQQMMAEQQGQPPVATPPPGL